MILGTHRASLRSLLATIALLSGACAGPSDGAAQAAAFDAKDGRLSIERLYSGEFGVERFGPSWWLEDSGLATLEQADGGGRDLVRFDPVLRTRLAQPRNSHFLMRSTPCPPTDDPPSGSQRPPAIESHGPDGTPLQR